MEQIQIIEKVKDAIFERLSYTNQDYNSIITELINLLPQLSPKWNNVSEADIVFIMLSIMAAHKDILNYMVDYRTLEGYMSTAKERQSLVRIANSFGYKIPSYRASKATLKLESSTAADGGSTEATGDFTLPSWTRLIDADNVSWAYIGNDTTVNVDDNINVYQGIPDVINVSIANIDSETKTHIFSTQSIAIGNNADDLGLSKFVITTTNNDEIVFNEVENIYTDTSGSEFIYHLAVDPQGINYIKFLDTFNKADYAGFSAKFYYVLTQGPNITSVSNAVALLKDEEDINFNVNFIEPTNGFNFTLGSKPFSAPEIREGFKQYYAGINSLVTLEDYKSFILNRQRAVLDIQKCLVIDAQSSTLEGLNGDSAFETAPGIYVLKEGNVALSANELTALKEEVAKYKVTGVIPSYNGENEGDAISEVPIEIQINKLPAGDSEQPFKNLVANYVNNKQIGAPLTSSEILNLIQNSDFAPNFTTDGIAIKLVIPNVTESTQRINIAYNEYMTCDVSSGIDVNTSL